MKQIKTALVVLFLVGCIASQSLHPVGISCPNNNPFITTLNGVNLYQTPTFHDVTCQFELQTYGSCCDPWQLKYYAINRADDLKRDLVRVNSEYVKFEGIIPQLYQTFKRIALAPRHPTREDWNRKIDLARELFNSQVVHDYFQEVLTGEQLGTQDFESQSNACWDMQSKARNMTLCFTCSGRSNHFFRDRKALIGQGTCDAFVQKCSGPLSSLVKFVKSLEILPWLTNKMKEFDLYLNADSKLVLSEIDKYFTAFESENIEQLIQTARTYSNPETKSQMCSKFLRLKETPIVIQMRTIFSSDSNWLIQLWDIKNHLDQSATQIDANIRAYDAQFSNSLTQSTTNWKISRRRLLRMLQFSDILTSDSSILSSSDPSYSSVGVTGNSPMDFGFGP